MEEIELLKEEQSWQVEEAYKSLRANVDFVGVDKKVLVFTSCIAGEGKSTVSLALARSFAESGRKILYIDADLRKSVLMSKCDVQDHEIKGLSHFLSGHAELNEVIYKVKNSRINIIFSGVVPPNPTELLGNARFRSFLQFVRPLYDYIIIDSPPLGSVIDSAIIAGESDGCILVTGANMVSHKLAREVKKQLEKTGCPILGVVLNKIDVKHSDYYNYYYKKNYYKE